MSRPRPLLSVSGLFDPPPFELGEEHWKPLEAADGRGPTGDDRAVITDHVKNYFRGACAEKHAPAVRDVRAWLSKMEKQAKAFEKAMRLQPNNDPDEEAEDRVKNFVVSLLKHPALAPVEGYQKHGVFRAQKGGEKARRAAVSRSATKRSASAKRSPAIWSAMGKWEALEEIVAEFAGALRYAILDLTGRPEPSDEELSAARELAKKDERFKEYISKKQDTLEASQGLLEGRAWQKFVCRLWNFFEERGYKPSASHSGNKSPFVAFVWELQKTFPKEYQEHMHSPEALAEAISKAIKAEQERAELAKQTKTEDLV